MKINPLDAAAASKNKSKDIHLTNIDVNFGSNRILSGASLTLAYGRRYGLIGRNGVGKSTLLRHIALRDVPIPPHITILFVEQEEKTACLEDCDQCVPVEKKRRNRPEEVPGALKPPGEIFPYGGQEEPPSHDGTL